MTDSNEAVSVVEIVDESDDVSISPGLSNKTRDTFRTALLAAASSEDIGSEGRRAEVVHRIIDMHLLRYGVLPPEHPLTVYIKSLFARICSDPSIEIMVCEGDMAVNAFASANRKIVFAKGLIQMCDTEEELLFVMHHEMKHIENEHFKAGEQTSDSIANTLLKNVGKGRIREVGEADIESLAALDEKGVNIDGAFTFFKKLEAYESDIPDRIKRIQKLDLEHGRTQDRVIGLKTSLHFKDYKHYKPGEQTPIPEELKDPALYEDTYGFPIRHNDFMDVYGSSKTRKARIGTMTGRQLFVSFVDYQGRLDHCESLKEGSKVASLRNTANKYVLNHAPLAAKMRELCIQSYSDQSGISPETIEGAINFCLKASDISGSFHWHRSEAIDDLIPEVMRLHGDLSIEDWERMFSYSLTGVSYSHAEFPNELIDSVGAKTSTKEEKNYFLNVLSLVTWGITYTDAQEVESESDPQGVEESGDNLSKAELATLISLKNEIGSELSGKRGGLSKIVPNVKKHIRENVENPINILFEKFFRKLSKLTREKVTILKINDLVLEIMSSELSTFEKNVLVYTCSLLVPRFSYEEEEMDGPKYLENCRTLSGSLQSLLHSSIGSLEIRSSASESFAKDSRRLRLGWMAKYYTHLSDCSLAEKVELLFQLQESEELSDDDFLEFLSYWDRNILTSESLKLADYLFLFEKFKDLPGKFMGRFGLTIEWIFYDSIRRRFADHLMVNPATLIDDESQLDDLLDFMDAYSIDGQGKLFKHLMSLKTFSLDSIKDNFTVIRIANFCDEALMQYDLSEEAWERILTLIPLSEFDLMGFLESVPKRVKIPARVMEIFSEDYAETEEEIEACKAHVIHEVKDELTVGKLIIAGEVLNRILKKNKLKFALALLNPENDNELRSLILDASMEVNFFLTGSEGSWKKQRGVYPNVVLDTLYFMDDQQRRILVHILLTGENGILSDTDQVAELMDFLFSNFIESSDENEETDEALIDEIKKIIQIAIEIANPEDIYFILSNLLYDRLLKAPYHDDWTGAEKHGHLEQVMQYKTGFSDKRSASMVRSFIFGPRKKKSNAAVDYLLPKKTKGEREANVVDAVGLIIEIAQSMGSIGTRFLQIMGMYMDVPQRYQDAIRAVFSDVRGQYKLTAYDTIKAQVPQDRLSNLHIGKRIGGGAMVTVYPFKSDEMEGVAKVLNPNTLGFTETVFDILEQTFQRLIDEDPEKYAPLPLILRDIKAWVLADANLAACADLDEQFRRQNDGIRSDSLKYTSRVPQVLYYGERCIVEEIVSGRSLQDVERPGDSEVDEMIGLIQTRFFQQVLAGIVHSDVHPGNFHISDGDEIFWLDRTLLLNLTDDEKMCLMSSAMQTTDKERMTALANGLLAFPQNADLDKEAIVAELAAIAGDSRESLLKAALVLLRKKGVEISLNLTLILKNLIALEKLGSHVGARAAG